MSVRKYSERITARLLKLTPEQNRDAVAGLKQIYAGSQLLRGLPVELFMDIGGLLVELVVSAKLFRQKPRQLAEEILKGSPPLAASVYAAEIRQGALELEEVKKHGTQANGQPARAPA